MNGVGLLASSGARWYHRAVRHHSAPSGKISFVGLVTLLVIVGGIWWAYLFVPTLTDDIDVQNAVDIAFNNARRGDDFMKAMIENKLRYVGTHREDDGYGNIVVKRGLGLTDDDIVIDRDPAENELTVQVNYAREIRLKPLNRWVVWHFHPSKEGPLSSSN